jgi:uncharacterized protein (DUF983 family)
MTPQEIPDVWTVAGRGALCRCPKCGKGKLFARYLKQVDACSVCAEPLGHIRADDGPAWLTIVILGHILAPVLLGVVPKLTCPVWQIMVPMVIGTTLLALLLLPLSKGVFIGVLWRLERVAVKKE